MEQLSIKDLDLNETKIFLDEVNPSSDLKDFCQTMISSIFQMYKTGYSTDDILVAILYNSKNFEEMFVAVMIFVKRHQTRVLGDLFIRLDELRYPDVLNLNLDPEQSMLGVYEPIPDAEFTYDVILASLQKDSQSVDVIDVVKAIKTNPLPEISNWSTLLQVLFGMVYEVMAETDES